MRAGALSGGTTLGPESSSPMKWEPERACVSVCTQCVSMHVCACVHVYNARVHMCMCVYGCVCVHVYGCVRVYMGMPAPVCTSQRMCARVYKCVRVCARACTCMLPAGSLVRPLASPAPGPRAGVSPRLPALPARLSQIRAPSTSEGSITEEGPRGASLPRDPEPAPAWARQGLFPAVDFDSGFLSTIKEVIRVGGAFQTQFSTKP